MKGSWLCCRDAHLRTASLSKLDVAEMQNRSKAAHHVLLMIRRETHGSVPAIQPIEIECLIVREGVCTRLMPHTGAISKSPLNDNAHTIIDTHEHANSIINTRPLSLTTLLRARQHGIAR